MESHFLLCGVTLILAIIGETVAIMSPSYTCFSSIHKAIIDYGNGHKGSKRIAKLKLI